MFVRMHGGAAALVEVHVVADAIMVPSRSAVMAQLAVDLGFAVRAACCLSIMVPSCSVVMAQWAVDLGFAAHALCGLPSVQGVF